jgi:hypothetical protein
VYGFPDLLSSGQGTLNIKGPGFVEVMGGQQLDLSVPRYCQAPPPPVVNSHSGSASDSVLGWCLAAVNIRVCRSARIPEQISATLTTEANLAEIHKSVP